VFAQPSSTSSAAGSTLIEVVIATGLVAVFLGSLFTMNSASMDTIKMARQSAAASQVLQQRVESLRIANWHQVTDPDWLKANLLNTAADGSASLQNLVETLTLIPYGSTTVGNTVLTRSGNSASVTSENAALLYENAIKVVWTLTFRGTPNQSTLVRQTVAILAKGGVAK
jgi:Tfp pilus assembly protein PilV